jgi:hypothetical protein
VRSVELPPIGLRSDPLAVSCRLVPTRRRDHDGETTFFVSPALTGFGRTDVCSRVARVWEQLYGDLRRAARSTYPHQAGGGASTAGGGDAGGLSSAGGSDGAGSGPCGGEPCGLVIRPGNVAGADQGGNGPSSAGGGGASGNNESAAGEGGATL